ncbi:hypothetical protein ACQ4PT_026149 [Festuca glaucescens]
MASPPRPTKRLARAPAPAAESDDILRQIFILLNSPADLARACAASPAFCRVITDPHFLRRFRALHSPPLLSILKHVFHPAEPPHPSASAARKLVNDSAIDFSCKSFLPYYPGTWYLRDSRDGRILFSGNRRHQGSSCESHSDLGRPLAVRHSLHRRYLMLPAIPEEVAALVDHGEYLKDYMTFLAPPAEEEEDGSTTPSFRVMCMAQSATKLVLFVFSSSQAGGRQWCGINYDDISGLRHDTEDYYPRPVLLRRCYVHGRFYWPIYPG